MAGAFTASRRRFIAPDLARGLALVGIAMANMVTDWDPAEGVDHAAGLGGYNGAGTVLEKTLVFFETLFVHVRGLPMFATLLGVGAVSYTHLTLPTTPYV